jgi:signal transduction histidine kinase
MSGYPPDPFSSPSRPAVPGLLSLLVDGGYLLLISGLLLLATALIPGQYPLLPIAATLIAALILLPLRNNLAAKIRRMEKVADTVNRSAFSYVQASAPDRALALDSFYRAIHSTVDFDVLLELVYTQTARFIPLHSFRIALLDGRTASLCYAFFARDGRRCTEREGIPFPMDQELAGTVARSGSMLLADSYANACQARRFPQREPSSAWAGIPLPSGASTIGVMIVLREEAFSPADGELLEAVAAHVGPAIAKARLQKETARRTALLEALQRASRRLIGTLEWNPLLNAILAGARELLSCQAAVLLLPDPSGGWTAARQSGLPHGFEHSHFSAADLPLQHIPADDRPVYFASLPSGDPFRRAVEASGLPSLRTATSLPLHRKEQLLGWLVFFNPQEPFAPSREEEPLLAAYATLAAAALENARLFAQTDRSLAALVEELGSLQHLDQELNAAADTDQAMAITLDWALRHTDAPAGMAVIPVEGGFEVVASSGYPEGARPDRKTRIPLEIGGLVESLRLGKALVRRVEADDSAAAGLLLSGKAAVALPIRREKQVMGALLLESGEPDAFFPMQVEFLQRLAAHAAIAISNAQLYAEVQNANQAKSEFISFVAHELKTPMTSIRGYTDLLAQGAVGSVSPQQANFLATIRSNADRMASLVSDLNDISRIESGRLRLEYASCSLNDALAEVLQGLQSQIEAKQQQLTIDLPPDLPSVWADRGRLIQILANLVSNAHKYTSAGGVIRVSAERSANRWDPTGPPDVIHCTVEDSGLGITPQEQKSIFQKFFRSEDRLVRDLPGTGLGLHITRNLVELQGGRIWFESELRRGTTFHFTVPEATL